MKSLYLYLFVVLASACGSEDGVLQEVEEHVVDFSLPMTEIDDGVMSGDVGPLLGLDAASDQLEIFDDGRYVSVTSASTVFSDGHYRGVMMLIGTTNRDLFEPGVSVTFSDTSLVDGSVDLLGCIGPMINTYDIYDEPANEIHFNTFEGDAAGQVKVIVDGFWTSADHQRHQASLSFQIQR
jgi:hypothetical protein